MSDDEGFGVPTLVLADREDEMLGALRHLQKSVLKHPAAAQAAFQYLSAEGRRYRYTAEGREWDERLRHSRLVRHLGLLFDFSTLSLLDHDPPGVLPTQLLDVLFTLSSLENSDELLDKLFRWEQDGHA
ncbi:hypothetical protein [Piscinibacter koreensis]|uniref:Uncharacterized protein n=1 Tax=Piscinibacter koreensis TaxID=2742824 RepID=A0A7Y6NMJ4_9BURK|nr:hypothetical protein [Schlegelella koreensis]NUZ05910.1 hypothetical protein [Schlegelella koreensis]